jgi:hypothetical protein
VTRLCPIFEKKSVIFRTFLSKRHICLFFTIFYMTCHCIRFWTLLCVNLEEKKSKIFRCSLQRGMLFRCSSRSNVTEDHFMGWSCLSVCPHDSTSFLGKSGIQHLPLLGKNEIKQLLLLAPTVAQQCDLRSHYI